MRAAWYERQGPAQAVLVVGQMPDPEPGANEVRIRIAASGINPGDTKKRGETFGLGMPYPRIIPHSDGAGVIDRVGASVDQDLLGKRVWCFGAQSYRAFRTAAEFTVVPVTNVVSLPDDVSLEVGLPRASGNHRTPCCPRGWFTRWRNGAGTGSCGVGRLVCCATHTLCSSACLWDGTLHCGRKNFL